MMVVHYSYRIFFILQPTETDSISFIYSDAVLPFSISM